MVTWQLTIDANDPDRLARFWAPLLGYEPQPPPEGHASWVDWYRSVGVPDDELADVGPDYCDRIHDPAGGGPRIWFQLVPEGKTQKNRLHLDLYPTGRDHSLPMAERRRIVEATVTSLLSRGATVVRRTMDALLLCGDARPRGQRVLRELTATRRDRIVTRSGQHLGQATRLTGYRRRQWRGSDAG